MRVRIYFIRHAEARSNVDPLSQCAEDCLTELGVLQAQSIALRVRTITPDKVYGSNVLRAQLTANVIAKAAGVETVSMDFLRERTVVHSSQSAYEYAENFSVFKPRLLQAKSFLENMQHKHVIVVSHAIYLKSLAACIMLGDSCTEEQVLRVENTLTLDHAAISKFVYNQEKSKWHMESWNEQSHLN